MECIERKLLLRPPVYDIISGCADIKLKIKPFVPETL